MDGISEHDLRQIWKWNARVPETVQECIHEIFAERARSQPDAPAVCAWNGHLSYKQLDELSSRVAHHLVRIGVRAEANAIIPLCFEKSLWTPVAVLGVLKAGAACVLLADQPLRRLQTIVQQLQPPAILSSALNLETATNLAKRVGDVPTFVVDQEQIDQLLTQQAMLATALPIVHSSQKLYVVFTSGSTGSPKGCIISHENFASAVRHQQAALGFNNTSRVFDQVAYSFDVAYSNIFHTLTAGGCLCIPNEQSRMSEADISISIAKLKANYAHVTPTLSRVMRSENLPSLETVNFIGEPLKASDVSQWRGRTVLQTYGPAETTVTSTLARIDTSSISNPDIGSGLGLLTWIVDPINDRLVGIGEIGELCLEGPLVGQGYLSDPEKMAASFIQDPPWLVQGLPGVHAGRRGRIYKTGDLVHYKEGTTRLEFVGRKDDQFKIRGQRTEKGDVEHHVRQLLPLEPEFQVFAEVVKLRDRGDDTLVVFVISTGMDEDQLAAVVQTLDLGDRLKDAVPTNMIPSAFLPLAKVPLTATGKTDRRQLRDIGVSKLQERSSQMHPDEQFLPTSTMELELRRLWEEVFDMDSSKISVNNSFLRLGGDSLRAMRLVSAARGRGYLLTVRDILQQPRLSEQARAMTRLDDLSDDRVTPLSLIGCESEQEARRQAASACGVSSDHIQDIYPCTALQEGLLAMTAKRSGDYVASLTLELHPHIDVVRLQTAWEQISEHTPILRTRIIDWPESQKLVQVLIDQPVDWCEVHDVDEFRRNDRNPAMTMGTPLTRVAMIHDEHRTKNFFALRIHHAVYDGWSISTLLANLAQICQGFPPQPSTPFRSFIKHVVGTSSAAAEHFWKAQFSDLEASQFPQLPAANYQPRADRTLEYTIAGLRWPSTNATPSSVIRVAWALLVAAYSSNNEAVFGAVVMGRQAFSGNESVMGPTISTVPVRIAWDPLETVESLITRTHQQYMDMIPFEQIGIQRIKNLSPEADLACQFQSLLIVQPHEVDRPAPNPLFAEGMDDALLEGPDAFSTYSLTLQCNFMASDQMKLQISFDTAVISERQTARLAQQLETTMRQLCALDLAKVRSSAIETGSERDMDEIWTWNASAPEEVEACVHDLILDAAKKYPEDPAVCAWDGELSYRHLEELSYTLALHLISLGVGREVVVPLCFEKSMWTPVAELAVLRAGAAVVTLDASQPIDRLRSIVQQVSPNLILSSASKVDFSSSLADVHVFPVAYDSLDKLQQLGKRSKALPYAEPSDKLYIVFTSGSTGTPKGVVVEHRNFSSAIKHHEQALGLGHGTRVLDFSSYAWVSL